MLTLPTRWLRVGGRACWRSEGAVGGALAILCTVYALALCDVGWIPHDEGQLGHTAERILEGELPHRDFVDPYTGGLGLLHALAFQLWGTHALALRWSLAPLFFLYVLSYFDLSRRMLPRGAAVLVTLLGAAFAWPVYPAAMPSWFNLFLATAGTAALLRGSPGRRGWWFAAGVCGGLSVLMKITGLYFIAAAILYLFVRPAPLFSGQRRFHLASAAQALLLLMASLAALYFLQGERPVLQALHFVVPVLAVVAGTAVQLWAGTPASGARLGSLAGTTAPFAFGVLFVVAPFVLLYALQGELHALWHGVFVLPRRRLESAAMALPEARWLLLSLPLLAVLLAGRLRQQPAPRAWIGLSIALAAALWVASATPLGHMAVLLALRQALPLVLLAAVWESHCALRREADGQRAQELWLLTSVAIFVSLVQFPYAGGFYFFFAAPLAILAAAATVARQPYGYHGPALVLGLLLLCFSTGRLHNPNPAVTGGPYRLDIPLQRLALPRGGVRIAAAEAAMYEQLVAAVQAASQPREAIFAGPDCPQVYFLAARRNPTRDLYSIFADSGPQEGQRLVEILERNQVRVIVLQTESEFTRRLPPVLLSYVRQNFPQRQLFYAEDPARPQFVMYSRSGNCAGHHAAKRSQGTDRLCDLAP